MKKSSFFNNSKIFSNKYKKQNGITLIALMITVIILLILAGVTLNLTLGERGIFNISKQAIKNYTDAQNEELGNLNLIDEQINSLLGTKKDIDTTVSNEEKSLTITENGEYNVKDYTTVNVDIPTYKPNSTLQITEKKSDIDVSNYQYADTTKLFTLEETSGENVNWKKETFTFPETTNSTISVEYNCGFTPSMILINLSKKDGNKQIIFSTDSCATVTAINNGTIVTSLDFSIFFNITNTGINFVNWDKSYSGCNVEIWTMK